MKKAAIRIMLVANTVSLALCAITLLWVLFSGFTGWWRVISNPLTQLLYIAVALFCLRSTERSVKWLGIAGILRAAVAGWQFVHSLRYFVGVSVLNIGDFLQFPATLVFLVALGLYWMIEKRSESDPA
ncbi:MAG: hypothetical protein IJX72_05535 [Clostridia bacterium]|nr:hypothetical protein [Clostridia bacterium]